MLNMYILDRLTYPALRNHVVNPVYMALDLHTAGIADLSMHEVYSLMAQSAGTVFVVVVPHVLSVEAIYSRRGNKSGQSVKGWIVYKQINALGNVGMTEICM